VTSDRVSVARSDCAVYPENPPFDPDEAYPEYHGDRTGTETNFAYRTVRKSLLLLGLDASRAGTTDWNPLTGVIRKGDTVLIKPNLVCESREGNPEEWEQIVTSGSVVRAVLDYVILALRGSGRILIADSPQSDSDFTSIAERTALPAIAAHLQERSGIPISVTDLRTERWLVRKGVCTGSVALPGDPLGMMLVDLGEASHFVGAPGSAPFYGAGYDIAETNHCHSEGRHVYEICRSALDADVIVSIPKLKTHKKCGMTGNLKGFVGLTGRKNFLPHYRIGSPSSGGDQYPDGRSGATVENAMVIRAKRMLGSGGGLARILAGLLKPLAYRVFGQTGTTIRSGNWYGNDTIWRTVLDLAAILVYASRDGLLLDHPARRFFCVVDGMIGGDGNGPLDADPHPAGLILAGESPVLVDAVSSAVTGLSRALPPPVREAFISPWRLSPCGPEGIEILIDGCDSPLAGLGEVPVLSAFRPHFGWIGPFE
jgi:uncharacterized protein (DUF362 family)